MYKNNSRFISKFKGFSPLQLSCNLAGKCYAVGYYSYTKRWLECKKALPTSLELLEVLILHLKKRNIMKALGISGSPNKNGNTAFSVQYALSILENNNIHTQYISLSGMN